MACPEDQHGAAALAEVFGHGEAGNTARDRERPFGLAGVEIFDSWKIVAVESFDGEFDAPAAALAEIGAQGLGDKPCGVRFSQHPLRGGERPPFQRAAADGAVKTFRSENDTRAFLAWA